MLNRDDDTWIQTYSGRKFWPLDPNPLDVCIADIAHALANKCRFSGHSLKFYSVAEHSVLMAREATPENKLAALLHDANEAYLPDVARPIKPYLPGYREIERRVDECVAEWAGLQYPYSGEVHELDTRILADELSAVMSAPPDDWRLPLPPLGVDIECWPPDIAERHFLNTFSDSMAVRGV